MATKKEATKKKTTTKKTTTKKTTKKVAKVTEEQFPSLIKEELGESTVEEKKIDWEKYKVDEGEYDLRNASEEEITSAFKEMKSEDEIFVTKNILGPVEPTKEEEEKAIEESVEKVIEMAESNEPIIVGKTEVMNGDPAVLTPKEEPKVEEKKENKPKIAKKINKLFTYFWNGQMIDF